MEYQEIANIWNQSDENIENKSQIRHQLIKEISVGKIKSQLGEIKWTSYFEIIINSFWMIFLLGFILDNRGELKFVLPALIVLVIALFSTILEIRKLKLFYTLSSSQSVIKTQKKLEKLRYLEHFDTLSLYIIIPLFAAPFLIIMAFAFLQIDLYLYMQSLILLSIGSMIISLVLVFILKRFPNKALIESIDFLKELEEGS